MHHRRVILSLLGAAVLLVAIGAVVVNSDIVDAAQAKPGTITFSILDRPPTDEDVQARARYTGDQTVSLADARLAGTETASGRTYFLTRNGDDICLVVVSGPNAAAGGCERASGVAAHGLFVKYGDASSSFIAVAVPDEYADATVRTAGAVLLHEPNLMVARADPLGTPTRVVLASSRYKDWSITTTR